MISASLHRNHNRRSATQKMRSVLRNRGRGHFRFNTISWSRRAATSKLRSLRERKNAPGML
jgi:hypothetical protein